VTFKRDPLNDHYYGTSINEINRIVKYGQSPVLEMNALLFSEFKDKVHCNGIYIKPSSYEALRNRL
jgi:guanylate kinase